jgi:hypothetical protein
MARVIDSNLQAAPSLTGTDAGTHANTVALEATTADLAKVHGQPAKPSECQTSAALPAGVTEEQLRALTERFGPLDTSRLAHKPPQA